MSKLTILFKEILKIAGADTRTESPASNSVFDPVVEWLVCIDGPEKGRDYRIRSGNNYIGRSQDIERKPC